MKDCIFCANQPTPAITMFPQGPKNAKSCQIRHKYCRLRFKLCMGGRWPRMQTKLRRHFLAAAALCGFSGKTSELDWCSATPRAQLLHSRTFYTITYHMHTYNHCQPVLPSPRASGATLLHPARLWHLRISFFPRSPPKLPDDMRQPS